MLHSRELMLQLVQQSVAIMQARQVAITDMQARIRWDDDTRDLLRQREALVESFPKQLKKALDDALRPPKAVREAADTPSVSKAMRFDQLELVDDTKMQSQIESARMQQMAENACERELTELDALVSSAQGLRNVQPDRNPFRPRTFCAALSDTLAATPATPEQRMLWLQQLGAVLGPELKKFYLKLGEFLQGQQVQAVGYHSSYTLAGLGSGGGGGDGGYAAPRPSAARQRARAPAAQLTEGQLRQVLGGEHFQAAQAYDAQGYDAQVYDQADDVMQDVEELSALVQQLAGGPGGSTRAKASRRSQGSMAQQPDAQDSELHTSRAHAISVHESFDESEPASADPVQPSADSSAVAQDVVRMLVDNLCDDPRLMEPVRDWVVALEPALLALAKIDVSFLSERKHPARVLLDEVTARSLGFSSERDEAFSAFFEPVLLVSAQLQADRVDGAAPFVQALQALEQAWAQVTSAAHAQREQAMQALALAEQRNLLADKIALELTRRDDARLAPIFVKQFMAGPWAQVLAKARLDPTQPSDPQVYLDVVGQLLWSVVVEEAARQKQRLVTLIPDLLKQLRAGLATVGGYENEAQAFFAQLIEVHEKALKPGGPKPAAPTPSQSATLAEAPITQAALLQEIQSNAFAPTEPEPEAQAAAESFASHVDHAAWMEPQAMRDSGFIEDESQSAQQPVAPSEQTASPAQETSPSAATPQEGGAVMQPPSLGSWVEFLSNDKWVRAQLTWASPHGTLFMFTGAAGNPHSMTRRALDKMLARQAMRVATQDNVVIGALDAVAQAAVRRSLG